MYNDNQRISIIEKIAYYLSEERKQKGLSGDKDHDYRMAEIELVEYEFFIKEYGYITEIIKEVERN